MNPFINKQFMSEAWDFNESLETPFLIVHDEPSGYYYKNNFLKFNVKLNRNETNIKDKKVFSNIIEKATNNVVENTNSRTTKIAGQDFLKNYFPHFFNAHPELQLDLCKFFNTLRDSNLSILDFLSENKKTTKNPEYKTETLLPLTNTINKWLSYSSKNLSILNDMLINQDFKKTEIIDILKKYVQHNLKIINKQPHLSSDLENFLYKNHPEHINHIASNVVAIKSRQTELKEEDFNLLFKNEYPYAFTENINLEKLLKTVQVPGWNKNRYVNLLNAYNDYIQNHLDGVQISIEQNSITNQKEFEFLVKMKEPNFNIEMYKQDLFALLKFFRNNIEENCHPKTIATVLLEHELQKDLTNITTNGKKFKV